MEQLEKALLANYDSLKAAQRSGEGRAIDYQGHRLGQFMRTHNFTMSDIERLVLEREE